MRTLCAFLSTVAIAVCADACDLNFCPAGFFSDDGGKIVFNARKHSSDYQLSLPDGKTAIFSGPIFPPYIPPKPLSSDIDAKSSSLTAAQRCPSANATVKKSFSAHEGGILSEISCAGYGDSKKPLRYRILLPRSAFAGKAASINGKPLVLPLEKAPKATLFSSRTDDELRFPFGDGLALDLKLLSGVASYSIVDRLHNGSQEDFFDIYISMEDGVPLKYLLSVRSLAKGPESPLGDVSSSKRNLLGEGSGFEVGPHGVQPLCVYSWGESWTDAGSKPVFDSSAAHGGRYSLKLVADDLKDKRGRFHTNQLRFAGLKFDPSKDYTFSAWVRSDSDKVKVALACQELKGGASKSFEVAREWRRVAFTFKPDQFSKLNFRQPTIALQNGAPKGASLWIDDVQLEEGDTASDYEAEPVEFGASLETPFKLFTPETLKNGFFTLLFKNNTDASAEIPVDFRIKDYWGAEVAKGSFLAKIPARGNLREELPVPALPFGYYRVDFDSADGKHHDEAVFGVYQPIPGGELPVDWPLGCNDLDDGGVSRELGFGWTRCWDFKMKRVCPKEGEFNFVETDIIVERALKTKMGLVPIFGVAFPPYHTAEYGSIPEWAVEKDLKSAIKGSWAKSVRFPKIAAWKTYVKALVSRYKGRIKAWELLNEANCWITADEYFPYMKATYEAAKEADPDCVIIGGGATSDWKGEPAPWTMRLLELGGAKYMDALGIHMYGSKAPEDSYDNGTYGMLEYLKGELRKLGREMPIWHTEKSYCAANIGYSKRKVPLPDVYYLSSNSGSGHKAPSIEAKAEWLLRETLIDSAVGKAPFLWFGEIESGIYIMPKTLHAGYWHTEYDGSPMPELLAANGLARMLQGRSHPVELVKLGSSKFCALFEGPDGALAALWDKDGSSALSLPAGAPAFTSYNFFGAEIPKEGSALRIGTAPIYLRFDGLKASVVKDAILGSEGSGSKLSFSGGLELEDGKPVLAVYALDKTWRPFKTLVKLDASPSGWTFGSRESEAFCEPGDFKRVAFKTSKLSPASGASLFDVSGDGVKATLGFPPFKSMLSLKASLSDSTRAEAFKVAKSPVVDADLSDWSDDGLCGAMSAGKVKLGRSLWRDPLDLSVEARFRWDSEKLYFAAEVFDDKLERHASPKQAYASDCVELFLSGGADLYQLLIAPGDERGSYKEASAWNCHLNGDSGILVASKRTPLGYVLEAAIPWSSIGLNPAKIAPGLVIPMSFQASDCDSPDEGSSKKIYWAGDDGNHADKSRWGSLLLK